MRKTFLSVAVVCTLIGALTLPSCIGSFSLTNKLLTWNNHVGSKFVNELVFFAFWIIPVYEISGLADILVLNTIEFWSGDNPVACGSRVVEGNDGKYLVVTDENGYTITSQTDGTSVRLDFNKEDKSWAIANPDGSHQTILTYVDDTHVAMPAPDGGQTIVELSNEGLYAYQQLATVACYAQR